MAVDEAILRCHAQGKAPPTFRLYGWRPPALSLGRLQSFHREVDTEACRRLGVDVVRRPTGGRAVLHDMEVTYSFIVSESNPFIPRDLGASFSIATSGIIKGLGRFGVTARIQGGRLAGRPGPHREASPRECQSAACFDAPSWYEVVAEDGRKLVGSAQARIAGVLLQHGSILLDFDIQKLVSIFKFKDPAEQDRVAAELREKATSLSELLGRPVGFEEVCDAVAWGVREYFRDAMQGSAMQVDFEIDFEEGQLTPDELALAEELAATKYGMDAWTAQR
ncbi:MAG: lipoate--protein ligase family protein [Firmicutes bacterium]|nr:lipoate--protein ligase family protein [Bacillota bacterium]